MLVRGADIRFTNTHHPPLGSGLFANLISSDKPASRSRSVSERSRVVERPSLPSQGSFLQHRTHVKSVIDSCTLFVHRWLAPPDGLVAVAGGRRRAGFVHGIAGLVVQWGKLEAGDGCLRLGLRENSRLWSCFFFLSFSLSHFIQCDSQVGSGLMQEK